MVRYNRSLFGTIVINDAFEPRKRGWDQLPGVQEVSAAPTTD